MVNKLSRQKKPQNCPQLVLVEAPKSLRTFENPYVWFCSMLQSTAEEHQDQVRGTPTPSPELQEGLAPGVEVKWREKCPETPRRTLNYPGILLDGTEEPEGFLGEEEALTLWIFMPWRTWRESPRGDTPGR